MKSSVSILALLSCGLLVGAQTTTPPPKTPPAQTAPSSAAPIGGPGELKVRGPEAVAKQDPNKVVAVINGHSITAQQALDILRQIPEDQRQRIPSLANLLQQVYMVDQFSDQAQKERLDQQEPWKQQIELNRKEILAQAYIANVAKAPASSASNDAQQYYNSHKSEFEQVKLSGIFIAFNPPGTPASGSNVSRTEAEAQQKANDLEKKIKDGGDFSALARTESDQQQSAVRGGDLGTMSMADPKIPDDIKAAVAKLQPGQVSEPIHVPNGYFILKLDTRTDPTFSQMRTRIVQQQEVEKYKIQVQDPDFFASNAPSTHTPSLLRPSTTTPAPAKPEAH